MVSFKCMCVFKKNNHHVLKIKCNSCMTSEFVVKTFIILNENLAFCHVLCGKLSSV